jgi:hypothetical protein
VEVRISHAIAANTVSSPSGEHISGRRATL